MAIVSHVSLETMGFSLKRISHHILTKVNNLFPYTSICESLAPRTFDNSLCACSVIFLSRACALRMSGLWILPPHLLCIYSRPYCYQVLLRVFGDSAQSIVRNDNARALRVVCAGTLAANLFASVVPTPHPLTNIELSWYFFPQSNATETANLSSWDDMPKGAKRRRKTNPRYASSTFT